MSRFISQYSVQTTEFIIDKFKTNWSDGLTAWQIPQQVKVVYRKGMVGG